MEHYDSEANELNIDKLNEMKLWLFQENIRLETQKTELEEAREKFNKERTNFRKEMEALNQRSLQERKRLREENLFFDKKMAILQEGFRQLEEDRNSFRQEKAQFQNQKQLASKTENSICSSSVAERLFSGITNPLVLRKRYKDLVKIFHPDNLFGDEELLQMINKEYLRRKEEQ